MTHTEIIQTFIDRINMHNIDKMCELMTEDHLFIDNEGYSVGGRKAMRTKWRDYFAMMPDYWIQAERIITENDTVAVFGRAIGTCAKDGTINPKNVWKVNAAWRAVIRDGKVALWQIYSDINPIRTIMKNMEK